MRTAVDTSVLLDVLSAEPRYGERSRAALLTRDRGFYRRYFSGLRILEVA